jgi:hypothetical protein
MTSQFYIHKNLNVMHRHDKVGPPLSACRLSLCPAYCLLLRLSRFACPASLEMFTDQALKSLQVIDIVQLLSLMMENNRPNNKRNNQHMDSIRVFCDISHKMRK